jgi:two-component system invasion response regulator UvrY
MRVLVVDDQRVFSHLVAAWLRKLSDVVRVELATSADEALALMESIRPDLVITDLRMPGMDGFELTRKVKEKAPAPVVIVMTSTAPPQFRESADAAGADYFLEKDNLQSQLPAFLQKRFGLGPRN